VHEEAGECPPANSQIRQDRILRDHHKVQIGQQVMKNGGHIDCELQA
jgi:hypothetical protein